MTELARFFAYVQAFEMAFATDDWSLIAPHFAENAVHHVSGGPPYARHDVGRDAVVAGLAAGVRAIDYRFDARVPEVIDGPAMRDGGIWLRFRLTLCRAGLPDLAIEGEHHAFYDGGDAIARLEESVSAEDSAATVAYLAEHGDRVRPAGSPPSVPADPQHLARAGRAIESILDCCHALAESLGDDEAARALGRSPSAA